jgi:preprotein translocase subunit SecA
MKILMGLLKKVFGDYSVKEVKRVTPIKNKVLALEDEYSKLTDKELQAKTDEFKERDFKTEKLLTISFLKLLLLAARLHGEYSE